MCGFLVEQICLSTISVNGLTVDGVMYKPLETIVFQDDLPSVLPIQGKQKGCRFYIPIAFNFKAIDGLILSWDRNKMEAILIPIQITIAKTHSDSVTKFFSDWSRHWSKQLPIFTVKVIFVWIGVSESWMMQHTACHQELRNRTLIMRPNFTEVAIHLKNVNDTLDNTLSEAKIEGENWEKIEEEEMAETSTRVSEVAVAGRGGAATRGRGAGRGTVLTRSADKKKNK
jgi:hypothetical protein